MWGRLSSLPVHHRFLICKGEADDGNDLTAGSDVPSADGRLESLSHTMPVLENPPHMMPGGRIMRNVPCPD